MPKKRVLSPQSVWDVNAVTDAFSELGIKQLHIYKLYKYVYFLISQLTQQPTSSTNLLLQTPSIQPQLPLGRRLRTPKSGRRPSPSTIHPHDIQAHPRPEIL